MATPNQAPRRTAAQMGLDIATGVPSPGANSYQAQRKAVSSDGTAEAGTYMKQRDAGKTGVTPTSFPDTKVSK